MDIKITADDALDTNTDRCSTLLAELCMDLYGSANFFHHRCLSRGFSKAEVINAGWATLGIVQSDRVIIFICEGSDQLGDWIKNFQIWPVKMREVYPAGKVSHGMRKPTRRLLNHLVPNALFTRANIPRQSDNIEKQVIVIGHSRGGPLAENLAMGLFSRGFRVNSVVTFESPRHLTQKAVGAIPPLQLRSKMQRFVHVVNGKPDLVTLVPGDDWIRPFPKLYYRHSVSPTFLVHVNTIELSMSDNLSPLERRWWNSNQMENGTVLYNSPSDWVKLRTTHSISPMKAFKLLSGLRAIVERHSISEVVKTLHQRLGI